MRNRLLKNKRIEDYTYIVARDEPLSFTAESYQKMIINLEYANVDNNYKVIQFTSTLEGEGKTTTISSLAYLLGQRGKKVLVIDLDFRRPKIHRIPNVANVDGIKDYLLGKISKDKMINKSEELNVSYIVSGQKTTSIANILTSNKLAELISELKEDYDYILLDTPPVLAVSDALLIARLADGIITIVSQNKAVKKEVKEMFNEVKKIGKPIIGSILTQVQLRKKAYKNYYYYENDDKVD